MIEPELSRCQQCPNHILNGLFLFGFYTVHKPLNTLDFSGTAVITDLLPHDEDWMREEMGDYRLGLRPEDVMGALAPRRFSRPVHRIHSRPVRRAEPEG